MSNFLQRVITAVTLIVIAIACMSGNDYTFLAFFGAVGLFALWEFYNIVLNKTKGSKTRRIMGMVVGILPFILWSIHFLAPESLSVKQIAFLFSPVLFMVLIIELFLNAEEPFASMGYILTGFIYVGIPFSLFVPIHFHFGNAPILGMWAFVAAFDVAAYLVGSQIGKTPLYPRISPKKTWEGVGGGVGLLVIFFFLLPMILNFLSNTLGFEVGNQLSYNDWIAIAAISLVFGTIGDLVESMLKRTYNVKDSGTLLPGHGGFLDRFDSVFFPVPFIAAYLFLMVA